MNVNLFSSLCFFFCLRKGNFLYDCKKSKNIHSEIYLEMLNLWNEKEKVWKLNHKKWNLRYWILLQIWKWIKYKNLHYYWKLESSISVLFVSRNPYSFAILSVRLSVHHSLVLGNYYNYLLFFKLDIFCNAQNHKILKNIIYFSLIFN